MPSRAGQARAKQRDLTELGSFISVEVDGQKYLLAARDMTALDVRAMRQQVGYSFNTLIAHARGDMDVDVLAAVVWMCRRINGEPDLTYAEVAGQMSFPEWSFSPPEIAEPTITAGGGDSPEM